MRWEYRVVELLYGTGVGRGRRAIDMVADGWGGSRRQSWGVWLGDEKYAEEEDFLAAMGDDGWEMTGVAPSGSNGTRSRLFFKRPKQA